jgi:hypothetical protein
MKVLVCTTFVKRIDLLLVMKQILYFLYGND